MSPTVRLSIKAANGSVRDYRIDAQTSWTVHQLKNHLYRHYPTHPPLTSQKLIYGGRLLLDQQTLAQSLPTNSEEPVIVHLVAYERSHSSPAVSTKATKSSPSTASRQPSLSPVTEEGNEEPPEPATPERRPDPVNAWSRFRGQTPPMMMGLPPQFYMSPYGAAYANQMALWYQAYYGRQVPPTPAEGVDENVDLMNPAAAEGNVEVEDEVPVNAAGGAGLGMMAGGGADGLRHRRDLVDVLYMCIMFGFLGLVAYLTGSLGRLLVFAGGIIFMLLNQGGFFTIRRRRQAAPVEDVNPLNRADQLPQQPVQENQEEEEEVDGQDRTQAQTDFTSDSTPVEEPPPPQDQQRQGILATLFVFVTSFFTSLVPHQRPEFQAN